MAPESFRCFLVRKTGGGSVEASVETRPLRELPPGEVLIRVQSSSLNYKDALATQGHPGVVSKFPHVPGIDAAGIVEQSDSEKFRPGDAVLCTGYEQGSGRWGGWAEFVRAPADWVVPLPPGMTADESMVLGTAGFTAAQCVFSLEEHGVTPEKGPVIVSGATGGVGCLAVILLAKMGFQVTAVSGKPEKADWLRSLGAAEIISREQAVDETKRPLLAARWAGGVDTVGGSTLSTMIRSLMHRGCVAACGLVGGHDLILTVYPFILRGATLDGIDSAHCPYDRRLQIWNRLAGEWRLGDVPQLVSDIRLEQANDTVARMLRGETSGRILVRP
ncbi:MAG: YhdH/YhfP family quinone oxidoreductase [Planctomycetaceae bacterium]|nr:YhdH/YhfP family quinone oxidoreductase [Planctomycetaceae bacterium]